jgi:predicted transcriptional regulator
MSDERLAEIERGWPNPKRQNLNKMLQASVVIHELLQANKSEREEVEWLREDVTEILTVIRRYQHRAKQAEARLTRLVECMQEFVDRCEKGEVRSRYTYRKFKAAIAEAREQDYG